MGESAEKSNQEKCEKASQGWDMTYVGEHSPLAGLYHAWEKEQGAIDLPKTLVLQDEDALLTEQELLVAEKHLGLQLLSAARERYELLADQEGVLNRKADAKPFLYVSHNQMQAWLLVFPPINGGEAVTMAQLTDILEEHSVTEGIQKQTLYDIVQKQLYFRIFLVAKGRLPENGTSGYVIENFPRQCDQEQQEASYSISDYLAKQYIRPISKGEVIARAVPSVYGKNGMNVLGHEVYPPAVKEQLPLVGRNTILREDGTLAAELDGHVFFKDDRFHVQPLCVLEGNMLQPDEFIDFDGDVSVEGDLMKGVVIEAAGSIIVDGAVEGAVLRADGDVIVTAGILGDDTLVHAGGSIYAKYLDSVTVYAYGCVKADCILNSNVFSEEKILAVEGMGTINGGRLSATDAVIAKRIGSRAERSTEVILGEYPCQKDEYEEMEAEIQQLQKEISEGNDRIRQLGQEQLTGVQAVQYSKLRLQQAGYINKLQKLQIKCQSLQKYREDVTQCEVQADMIYPGAVIRIRETPHKIEQIVKLCTVKISEGNELMFIPRQDITAEDR